MAPGLGVAAFPFFYTRCVVRPDDCDVRGRYVASGDQVLSKLPNDLSDEFVYWRQFGFAQLGTGHIALWNPHVYSGEPFMGGFQAALFYPLDWTYLILPLSTAINLEITLHVFLFGLFTAAWLKRYELHPLAVLLACTVTMFGGPYFLHIYPGHLATLDAMAWIPLILLTVEELVKEPRAGWILIGIFAFSMQFLAGHPQTLFNTLVTCSVYGSVRLWRATHRRQTIVAIAIVGVAALAITAVQLWAGINASAEGTRQGGVPFAFATMFSFPPENFLTLLVPGLFGNMTAAPYWGRCYLWEMSAFFGLTGLTMAIYGTAVKFRGRAICISMVALLTVLALAGHTPLFSVLYRFVPGFDHFRSHSKFLVQATPFVAILVAQGMDHLIRSPQGSRRGAMLALVAVLVLGTSCILLWYAPAIPTIQAGWSHIVGAVGATGESYLPAEDFIAPAFVARAASFAAAQCLLGAVTLLAIALLLYLRAHFEWAAFALVVLGLGEMFWFANSSLATFSLGDTVPIAVKGFLGDHPGDDYRILELPNPNGAIAIGANDIWGYDPMVTSRYAEFVTYSQGDNPANADMYVSFERVSRMFRMLRLRYVFRNQVLISESKEGLPHLLLLDEWARQNQRNDILESLNSSVFDPERTAILETDPDPAPSAGEGPAGTVQMVRTDTDSMTISAHLTRPSLLLVTDCYSRYWRAISEPGSSQRHYTVIPADYTLMAVALSAGEHLFRLEYAPPGYIIGRWISLAGVTLYLLALGFFVGRIRTSASGGKRPDGGKPTPAAGGQNSM